MCEEGALVWGRCVPGMTTGMAPSNDDRYGHVKCAPFGTVSGCWSPHVSSPLSTWRGAVVFVNVINLVFISQNVFIEQF